MTKLQLEEQRVVAVMVEMWCRAKHSKSGVEKSAGERKLCESCKKLLHYAQNRVLKCPVIESKTTCKRCLVHCYSPQMRQEIREVMRYSGPRIIFRHPIMAIKHILK